MKMDAINKTSIIGGIVLICMMLIQLYANYNFDSNFNEYQEKRREYKEKQFIDAGFSEYQAAIVTNAIREETFNLKSTMFSVNLTQANLTTMSCLIVLSLALSAVKKSGKND